MWSAEMHPVASSILDVLPLAVELLPLPAWFTFSCSVAIVLIVMSVSGNPPRCSGEIHCLETHSVQLSSCRLHSRLFLENPSQLSEIFCVRLIPSSLCLFFPSPVCWCLRFCAFSLHFLFSLISWIPISYFFPKSWYLLSEQATKMLQGSCAFDYLSLLMLGNLHFIYLQDRVNGLKLRINAWLPSVAVYVPHSLFTTADDFLLHLSRKGRRGCPDLSLFVTQLLESLGLQNLHWVLQ